MELEARILERTREYTILSRSERRQLGRDLRRLGLSYGEIMNLIPVKKSTLATWCSGIELSRSQLDAITSRRTPLPGRTLEGDPYSTQRKRRREIELIRAQAHLEARHLVNDPFWTAGVALYWGGGSKTERKLSLSNADPAALRLFKRWAEQYLQPNFGWSARINLHADNDEPRAKAWWASELALSTDDFNKTYVKPDGTGHRKNHLPHGVCTLYKRRSTNGFHTTIAWIEFLQYEYGR